MEPVYTSGITRCPNGASDIFFTWDVRNGTLCAGVSSAAAPARRRSAQEADRWCSSFNQRRKHFDTLREANCYVARYDTWFHTA